MPIVIEPAGVFPLGFFDETRRYQLPKAPVIRADKIDPATQEWTSMVKDQDPIDAAVVEALWRVRGSGAAVSDTGARFLDLDKLDDRAPRAIESEARFALRRLVRRGDITLKSVEVSTGPDWAEVEVNYINNRTALQKKDRQAKRRVPEGIKHGQT
jgi:hypothetical protein